MYRGPQVLDMEYREQDWPKHGPGGPILFFFHQLCLVSSSSIHHHRLGLVSEEVLAPWGNWSRYHGMCHFWSLKPLNICTWVLLSLTTAWILHLPTWPCLGELTECPSKPVLIGFGLPLGGFLKSHRPLPSYYHSYILFPAHLSHFACPSIGLTYFQDYTLPCGKKGLKAHMVKASW